MAATAQEAFDLLLKLGKTAASAESCTGGLIAKLITDLPGSSAVFHCGAVTYSDEIKAKLLGVSRETLEKFGAVSEQTAREMAIGVRRLSGADFGVSSTGISGPAGDGRCEQVGLSFIAVSYDDKVVTMKLETNRDDRDYNRVFTAARALSLLVDCLSEKAHEAD